MIKTKKIVCVIPARLQSGRLPRKVLLDIGGKPMLQHVWERAKACPFFDNVCFAVDAEETAHLVQSFGAPAYMTSVDCVSGTKRLIEIMKQNVVDADIWVNWQGDEPFLKRSMIELLLSRSADDQECDIWTLMTPIHDLEEALDPSAVKVVTDTDGKALYFSRSTIPYMRDNDYSHLKKHLGIYAFTKKALKAIDEMPMSILEEKERLEQLSFLYHGLSMRVFQTQERTLGIDTPEDLEKAELFYRTKDPAVNLVI